jgi:CysZ protein
MLSPLLRAISQLDDPVFLGVLLRSLVLSVLAFIGLMAFSSWALQALVAQQSWQSGWLAWLGWAAGLAGGLGAVVLAIWLFVPVVLMIATLYSDRIADAVDRRYFPGQPTPAGAPIAVQAWDGLALGLQVLILQVVALVLALVLPGAGLLLGWAITGWAIGRGLFMAVAMRRMTRPQALQEYARRRWPVLVQGGLLAFGSTVPFVALLVPVVGVAALTHVLNQGRLNQGRLDRGPLNRTMPAGATMLGHGPASSPTDRKNGGVSLVQAP